MRFKSLMEGG